MDLKEHKALVWDYEQKLEELAALRAAAKDSAPDWYATYQAKVKPVFDIGSFLLDVEARKMRVKAGWNGPIGEARPDELSDIGHLIAIDVPRLVTLVRELTTGSHVD